MSTTHCISAAVAAVLAVSSSHAQTLVEWLDQHGHDSSPSARTRYWAEFAPSEFYEKSAEQNTRLLNALKIDAATPTLAFLDDFVSPGDSVKAKVIRGEDGHSRIGLESELRGQSFEADDGDTVDLGSAQDAGVFNIRLGDGLFARDVLLVLTPAPDGRLEVSANDVAFQSSNEPAKANDLKPEGYTAAVEKLARTIDSDRMLKALQQAPVPYIRDNVGSLGGTLVICSLTVSPPPIGPVAAKECLGAMKNEGLGFAVEFFAQYVDLTRDDNGISDADRLTDEEAKMLKSAMAAISDAGSIGFAIKSFAKQKKVCEGLELVGTIGKAAAGQIERDDVRMTVNLFVDQANKIVMFACVE